MFKNFLYTAISLSLFFGFHTNATSLNDRTIQSGPHAGQKLISIIDTYTIPGPSGSSRVHIPALAVDQAFNFFDRFAGTTKSFTAEGINPVAGRPGFEYLGGVRSWTGPTIANQRFLVIFDLNLHSSLKRLHVIDLETGEIDSFEAAHGSESECKGRKGYACNFVSNRDSNASPLGFFVANRVYNGEKHGGAVTMVGLEKSSNGFSGNDVPTTVVIHSAPYVSAGQAGRSSGCPAVSESNIGWIRDNVKDGVLFYFYHTTLDYEGREPSVGGIQSSVDTTTPSAAVESEPADSTDDDGQ